MGCGQNEHFCQRRLQVETTLHVLVLTQKQPGVPQGSSRKIEVGNGLRPMLGFWRDFAQPMILFVHAQEFDPSGFRIVQLIRTAASGRGDGLHLV